MNKGKAIDKDEYYSMEGLLRTVPFSISYFTPYRLQCFIESKKLRAVVYGKGKGRRYAIKGAWAINFLAKLDDGSF